MSLAGGVLLIISGLAIMIFGLFLFYAWLPLLYAVVGFDIGLLIGRSITGEVGTLAVGLGVAGAVALGAASYFLEPYRRILLGVSAGFLFGLYLAMALNLDTILGGTLARGLAFACAVAGGMLVPRYFNAFVIGTSAISGASIILIGLHHVFPAIGLFNVTSGDALPTAILIVLALAGAVWQSKNYNNWIHVFPGSTGSR
jgi:hypothetical protein